MKKGVFLPVFALAIFVSQGWAQSWIICADEYAGYCQFSNCDPIATGPASEGGKATCKDAYDNCLEFGILYTDDECENWSGIGNDPNFTIVYCKWPSGCEKVMNADEQENCKKNSTVFSDDACTIYLEGNDPNREALGCCLWDKETLCWTIWAGEDEDGEDGATKVNNCKTGSNKFWSGICPGSSGTCPTSNPVYPPAAGNSSSSLGTQQGGNSSSSSGGGIGGSSSSAGGAAQTYAYCVVGELCLDGPFTFSDCSGTIRGVPSNNCPGGGSGNGALSSSSSAAASATPGVFAYCIANNTCATGPFTLSDCIAMSGLPSNSCPDISSPIIVLPQPAQKNALSAMQSAVNLQVIGNAAIQVFDLKGNAVHALKIRQGSYIVPLSGLPKGLYIVKASSASWKQTVKVTVK